MRLLFGAALLAIGLPAFAQQSQPPASPPPASQPAPREWIDADTGHRIVRLSDDAGGSTLYFHDNSYSPQGDKYMFNTPAGIAVVDVAKIGTPEQKMQLVAPGGGGGYFARNSRETYFTRGGARGARGRGAASTQPAEIHPAGEVVTTQPAARGRGGRGGRGGGFSGPLMAINVDTMQVREVPNARGIVNCDETLSVTKIVGAEDPTGNTPRPATRPVPSQMARMFPGKTRDQLTPDQIYAAEKEDTLAGRAINPGPQAFVFTNLKTGQSTTTGYQYGDINHMQWNPRDPNLLLYCHEGTWHEVDRTWTIRSDGSDMRLIHKRSMDMEINGHEWWSFDGRTVWFDLQTPRSEQFWIAGVNIDTGKETRYHVDRDWWGVHYNSSRDNTLFSSDGGDGTQVAFAKNGMWINLFRVQPDGTLAGERLVNMSKHNYVTGNGRGGVEPNASITPDKKWVIFTGQFSGGTRHVYAVEIAKAK